jgi:hypothetical protein
MKISEKQLLMLLDIAKDTCSIPGFILVGVENPRFSNLGMNATPSTLTLNVFQNRSS